MDALNRRQSNRNQRRESRSWFWLRRRRHDPWLVFNMFTFTFEGQPLHGFNRLVGHQNISR